MRKTSYGRGGGYRQGEPNGKSFGPKPVGVGKKYDATITETSRRGDGVAKIDGFVIFVAGGRTGQRARIKITQVSQRFATGQIVESVDTSTTEATAASLEQESTTEGEQM